MQPTMQQKRLSGAFFMERRLITACWQYVKRGQMDRVRNVRQLVGCEM